MVKTEAYLTESFLRVHLEEIFRKQFIYDKIVPNSGIKNRPDYRNEELKLIVEFDGAQHYQNTQLIFTDRKKDKVYTEMGYKVVRIPYFIQISEEIIKHYFGISIFCRQQYPHGFIDKKAVLPADFCEMGVYRFLDDMSKLPYTIQQEIIESLKQKVKELGNEYLVLTSDLAISYLHSF